MWTGIIDNHILDLVIHPPRLTEEIYLQQKKYVVKFVSEFIFTISEIYAGYAQWSSTTFLIYVRNHLNPQYPNKWIGRGNDACKLATRFIGLKSI